MMSDLKNKTWQANFYLLKMEDSELCLQAANELGKETRFRFNSLSISNNFKYQQIKIRWSMLGKSKLTNGCPWNVPWAQSC